MLELPPARAPKLVPSLEPKHYRAICAEIGERLRCELDQDRTSLPLHLRRLLDRLAAK